MCYFGGSDTIAQKWTFYVTDVTDVRGRCYYWHFVRAAFCAESDGVKEKNLSIRQIPTSAEFVIIGD